MKELYGTENRIRRQIFETITSNPGLHCRALSRQLQIPYSTLSYHLEYLEKQGAVKSERIGKFLCYYSVDTVETSENKILILLRSTTVKHVILTILLQGSSSRIALSRQLGKHPSTIAEALQRLIALEIIAPVKTAEGSRMKKIEINDFMNHSARHEQFFLLKDPVVMSSVVRLYHERLCTDDISAGLIQNFLKKQETSRENGK
jgi:predicted transcriptional regulator